MSNGGREVGLVFNLNGCGGGSGSVKLKSLAVIKPPKKTIYKSGESFDPTGMVVEAGYSFGLTSEVTGYTVTPAVLTDGVTFLANRLRAILVCWDVVLGGIRRLERKLYRPRLFSWTKRIKQRQDGCHAVPHGYLSS